MKNQTNPMVRTLTKRVVAANRSRNRYIISAIALTTLLITTIFSIGMSFLKSVKLQEIRLMGTTAHAAVTYPSEEQLDKLLTINYVKGIGLQYNVGLIKNTFSGDMNLSLHWFNPYEWEKLRKPSYTNIVGKYPVNDKEIMVPLWVLHNMGIHKPHIGMKIPLQYYIGNDRSEIKETDFVLSGYFTDYMNIRSGNIDVLLVSEKFARASGNTISKNGAASVLFKDDKNVTRYCERLTHDLSLTGRQQVKPVPMYEANGASDVKTRAAFFGIILFIMFTGYLLIYNVMYISVARDIRFYGLLKAVGTTPSQLKKIIIGSALKLAAFGIPIGLFIGTIFSYISVPLALKFTDLETGVEISFHPFIYIGAILFAFLTTLIGAIKPAQKAAKLSIVETLHFTAVRDGRKKKHSYGGAKPIRMAWRNIFRDRKRAAVVLLSLFLGITTFMIITTLISSMNTDNFIKTYVKNDFILKNKTIDALGNVNGRKQKFTPEILAQLKEIKGVTNFRTTYIEGMSLKYNQKQFSGHLNWFLRKLNVKEKLNTKQIQDNFWGYIIGIDSRYIEELNKTSKKPIDIKAFERGDITLIGADEPELYHNITNLDVTLEKTGTVQSLKLGGFVPFAFEYAGGNMAPNLYVSEKALKKWIPDPFLYSIHIDVKDKYEKQALEDMKSLFKNDNEIAINSRLEQQEAMSSTKLMMFILGGGISLILAFIGILNFINVMSSGIMVRRIEFAMLESIGMTKRQLCRMLTFEGLGYGIITALLTGTLGIAATFGLFKLFKQQADYAIFTLPILPMISIIAAVFLVCILTPIVLYHNSCKASVIDRLREVE